MVILSAIPKLDVFQIAETLNDADLLAHLYTGFASRKNRLINQFVSRKDSEKIPVSLITDLWMLPLLQHYHKSSIYNEAFDRIVASKIKKRNDYKALLAWSGMAEHSLNVARQRNKLAVVGRESCHISVQNQILTDEYLKYGIRYKIDQRITAKELREYDIADKIYVCSSFVRNTFVRSGVSEEKLFVNPIAVPPLFKANGDKTSKSRFVILFLGKLTVRKGLRYLFEALEKVSIPLSDFEVWFVGGGERLVLKEFQERKKSNWQYFGFVPQSKLPELICQADLGIFPSLEDGFAQVVPQQLSCGIPVITTTHTGASDFIRSGENGFVIPPFDSDRIAELIEKVFGDRDLLERLRRNAAALNMQQLSPRAVGARFEEFFKQYVI